MVDVGVRRRGTLDPRRDRLDDPGRPSAGRSSVRTGRARRRCSGSRRRTSGRAAGPSRSSGPGSDASTPGSSGAGSASSAPPWPCELDPGLAAAGRRAQRPRTPRSRRGGRPHDADESAQPMALDRLGPGALGSAVRHAVLGRAPARAHRPDADDRARARAPRRAGRPASTSVPARALVARIATLAADPDAAGGRRS